MKITSKMIQLSKENKESQYFFYKGVNYHITGTSLKHDSCQLKNLDTGEYIRMETTDGSLGDVKLIPLETINKIRNNG